MFTGLNQLFTSAPRRTEQGAAAHAIRRHDPEYHKRSKKRKEQNEQAFDSDDRTTVSVEALSIFLENFLKSQENPPKQAPETALTEAKETKATQAQKTTEPKAQMPITAPPPLPLNNTEPAARAASAYRTRAQNGAPQTPKPNNANPMAAETGANELSAGDTRTIHRLLVDLKELSSRGVQFVHIEYGESFLASLVNAVDHIRHPEHYHKN